MRAASSMPSRYIFLSQSRFFFRLRISRSSRRSAREKWKPPCFATSRPRCRSSPSSTSFMDMGRQLLFS